MNKYQEEMLKQTIAILKSKNGEEGSAIIRDCKLFLTQNENYNCKQYELYFNNNSIESIDIKENDEWFNYKNNRINVNFEAPIKQIRLNFDLVDSIDLMVEYVFADKNVYDEKINKELKEKYIDESSARLVRNIYGAPFVIFNPCCNDYAYTEVEFIATDNLSVKEKDFRIILQRKRNDDGCNYVKFENIGSCGLKAHIYQYDKNGNLLIDYEIK